MIDKTRIKSLCRNCESKTNHSILQNEVHKGSLPFEHHPEDIYWWETKYQIIQCLGCDTMAFRTENINSEDIDYEGPNLNIELLPEYKLNHIKPRYYFNTPNVISRVYRETVDAFNSDMLILCSIGIRSLVEGICKAHKIEKGTITFKDKNGDSKSKISKSLGGKINGLAEEGIISIKSSNALQEHKFIGDTAVHSLEIPSNKALRLSIEILENILESLYAVPFKTKTIQRSRKSN